MSVRGQDAGNAGQTFDGPAGIPLVPEAGDRLDEELACPNHVLTPEGEVAKIVEQGWNADLVLGASVNLQSLGVVPRGPGVVTSAPGEVAQDIEHERDFPGI